mmetsp:Transcript_22120/g.71231  ORF Transcript_22120/g.71231 Transcript_22120/m.71231 type:complete len:282 (+) Transcript_22120:3052-3897(+)
MTAYSCESGWRAYWMLHSPTIPRCRTTRRAASRRRWYSSFDSVCDGATTMESPVWTPRGSKFSMLHTVTQLSAESRTTSYSTSFQPSMDFSMRSWGDTARAFVARVLKASSSWTIPEPRPPKAKAARAMHGYEVTSLAASKASSTVVTATLVATGSPISLSFSLKISRSSVATTASIWVPRTRTPYFSKMPFSWSSTPQFSAVWPPMDMRIASGFSRMITCSTNSGVTGIKNTWSAAPGSALRSAAVDDASTFVWTDAMFGFIRTTSTPSSFKALIAWAPE